MDDKKSVKPKKNEMEHPLRQEYQRILSREHDYYKQIQNLDDGQFFIDNYIGVLANNLTYKQKIKGFHLPFNTVTPAHEKYGQNYKFRIDPSLSA